MAFAVSGCAGRGAHPALDDAHAAVERARSAPRVRALAPAELDLAEVALAQAEAAARTGAPRAAVEHLAYVASQRAAFAQARAAAQVARSESRLLRRALAQTAIEARGEDQRPWPLSQTDPGPDAARDDQRQHSSLEAHQGIRAAAPRSMAADVEAGPQDIRLHLAKLTFAEAEPTEEALEELALAERLLHDPARRLLIEAEFDLPDPEARTLTERRVEVVRAFFLERGVAPARLVVQATADRRLRPPATFVDPTEGAQAIIDGPRP